MSSLQARTFTRTAGTAVNYAARLELLEHYLAQHEDIVRCAEVSLEWLARHAGVKQSACLAVDAESSMLVGIAAHGTVGEDIELFSWPLSDTHEPIISALQSPVTPWRRIASSMSASSVWAWPPTFRAQAALTSGWVA